MVLSKKLKSIKMAKVEGVIPYLTTTSPVRYDLVAVGEVVLGSELVLTALNGVAKPWDVYVEAIVARENLPSWNRRRPEEVLCGAALLLAGRTRRMWL